MLSIVSQGFSVWQPESFTFTAPGVGTNPITELLSFVAISPNGGLPPIALLDGVSINAVPESSTLSLLGVGLLGLIIVGLRRRAGAA